jgi:hypothetical protein
LPAWLGVPLGWSRDRDDPIRLRGRPGGASADDALAKAPITVFNTFSENGDETGVPRFKELTLLTYA